MVYSSNQYLTLEQMTVNAQYILDYLIAREWTQNAISGMLGNMQTESTINPGVWQNLDSSNTANGYGLVQWTPSSVYTDWAATNGFSQGEIDSQLQRILYEVTNNIQWIDSTMTFSDFTKSKDTAYNLGVSFMLHYERPADQSTSAQQTRGNQATYWYNNLTPSNSGGSTGGGGKLPPPSSGDSNSQVVGLLLCDALNGWKR